jgi:ribA/ribD-fused uncharacterized protein
MKKLGPIKKFTARYKFLGNFYPVEITYEGIVYRTSEHAYQAAKTLDPKIRRKIAKIPTAEGAKKFGQTIPLRPDWESIKLGIMKDICNIKFWQDQDLKAKLLATGDRHLEEGNHHGDVFYGTVNGKGLNKLGFILMEIRDSLRGSIPDTSGFKVTRRGYGRG